MAETVSSLAKPNSDAHSTVLVVDDDADLQIRLGVRYDPSD
jgi:hypothetical protein